MRRMYSENQLFSLVNEGISKGVIDNTKPLYFHPITIVQKAENPTELYSFSLIIINSDPKAYNTFTKLRTVMINIYKSLPAGSVARFPCTGSLKSGNNYYMICSSIEINGETNIKAYGIEPTKEGITTIGNRDIYSFTDSRVFDGVNKIN